MKNTVAGRGTMAKYREYSPKQTRVLPEVSFSDVRLIGTVRLHYFPNQQGFLAPFNGHIRDSACVIV